MYKYHWVTSDVQFRKGASIPPFWVGLGWADVRYTEQWIPNTINQCNRSRSKLSES